MALLLYFVLGLSTILAQTTILRLDGILYDLLIPLVVFLSLNFPKRKGILVVVILGLIMDILSGAIFGLYLSIYFWIFLSVKGLSKCFDVGDTIFQSVLIGVCVLGQHFMFCAPCKGAQLLTVRVVPVLLQTVFAMLTGPGILMLLEALHIRLQAAIRRLERNRGIAIR
ncbi:MAG: hypothetical protein HWN69_04465 [Desulfobacterales bacterium]|nr:hypothetical protein [Desulfobacterales bacterium]